MKIYSSSFPVDWMTVYLGGQYYLPGDPAFKAGRGRGPRSRCGRR